jgi:hypothetical protein
MKLLCFPQFAMMTDTILYLFSFVTIYGCTGRASNKGMVSYDFPAGTLCDSFDCMFFCPTRQKVADGFGTMMLCVLCLSL